MFFSTFGGTTSLTSRANIHSTKSLESYDAAKARTAANKDKIAKGLKRPSDHVGRLENYKCDDWEGLVKEV